MTYNVFDSIIDDFFWLEFHLPIKLDIFDLEVLKDLYIFRMTHPWIAKGLKMVEMHLRGIEV